MAQNFLACCVPERSFSAWCLDWQQFYSRTVNPALLKSSFVWLIQLSHLHTSLFKEIIMKIYLTQGKCEFIKLIFVL